MKKNTEELNETREALNVVRDRLSKYLEILVGEKP